MAFFTNRKANAERALKESDGTSFWTTDIGSSTRIKVHYAIAESVDDYYLVELIQRARYLLLKQRGSTHLANVRLEPIQDFVSMLEHGNSEDVLDLIEGVCAAIDVVSGLQPFERPRVKSRFEATINAIFQGDRISYTLANSHFQELQSPILGEQVFKPVVLLFNADEQLQLVERAYREAWEEFAKGRYSDAITDGATAIQEMCRVLGALNSQIGHQLKQLSNTGILNPHDSPLIDAVSKVVTWSGSVRGQLGDVHQVSNASKDDAHFFLSIVGALILRLNASRKS